MWNNVFARKFSAWWFRVYNYYLDNIVKVKELETKNILIDEKKYKDLGIYFTGYMHCKSIKMLSLFYHELMGKVKEREWKTLGDWWLYAR